MEDLDLVDSMGEPSQPQSKLANWSRWAGRRDYPRSSTELERMRMPADEVFLNERTIIEKGRYSVEILT